MGFREGRGTIDAIYLLKTVIGKNLEREKRKMAMKSGTVYVYFADLKAAFDNVDREEIVRMMEEVGLGRGLRMAVGKIYEETISLIVIEEKEVTELFNIVFADLEMRMRRCQEAVCGRWGPAGDFCGRAAKDCGKV